jgi:hypothetical protein
MSDRSYASVTFYQCTDAEWTEIVSMFQDNGHFIPEEKTALNGSDWPDQPALGHTFFDSEVRLGELHLLLESIASRFPDVYFLGEQEAYSEDYGDIDMQTELGYWSGEPDQGGEMRLSAASIKTLMNEAQNNVSEFMKSVNERLGVPHFARIDEWATGKRKPRYVIEEMLELAEV